MKSNEASRERDALGIYATAKLVPRSHLDLVVRHDLLVGGLTDVEGFSLEREDTVEVTSDNREAGHGK